VMDEKIEVVESCGAQGERHKRADCHGRLGSRKKGAHHSKW
jgi:hypothetical protein